MGAKHHATLACIKGYQVIDKLSNKKIEKYMILMTIVKHKYVKSYFSICHRPVLRRKKQHNLREGCA